MVDFGIFWFLVVGLVLLLGVGCSFCCFLGFGFEAFVFWGLVVFGWVCIREDFCALGNLEVLLARVLGILGFNALVLFSLVVFGLFDCFGGF